MQLLKHWKETWGSLLIILIPLLYTIEYTKDLVIKIPFHWVISLVLFIWAWVQTSRNFVSKKELTNNISSLENENGMLKSNLESIPENMVKIFYKHFNLGNEDRVTVYRVKDNEFFIPVGRFSDNPSYKKSGRSEYPLDSGFIGKCWTDGEFKIQNLPNYNRNQEKYIEQVKKKCDIDENLLKGLNMKSRSFYCKRLTFNGDEPIAVVVIESFNTSLPDTTEYNQFLEGPFGKSLVESIKNNLPIGEGSTN
ncbi:hypothetical protein EYB33_12975 [Lysinibacillus sphaericus]|uniref:hypothetical protein n=1 Tax=Lysinibacillus sphaericus TaxID=1421 RepID=UPI001E321C4D|nr:hypothetical protein [Lysinibacillus sphaericus]UDK97156.1 hypothetical protein EYB33_12975 [Lysinibacillus sphaericus]